MKLVRGSRTCVESLETRTLFAGDMITHWQGVAFDMLRQARYSDGGSGMVGAGPTVAARDMAVMDVAIYDAVNGIDGTSEQMLMRRFGPQGASEEAAAAQAAFRTLNHMFPNQHARLQQELTSSLATLGTGKAVQKRVQWGEFSAQRILAMRANDGSNSFVQYKPGTAPGDWQPDPLNPQQVAWGPGEGAVKTFVVNNSKQFLPPPPPALNSQAYADAVNQVESLGALNSTTRTADQTQTGIFWAYDHPGMGSPIVLYNQAVVTVAEQMGNTLAQNARLFALVGLANADAGFTAWETKFFYNMWRPISAIRHADLDGNAATTADPNWAPLGAPGDGVVPNFTPPFPSYVSGHATFGAATFEVLRNFYGTDSVQFTLTSDELPGVTRSFSSFSAAAQENGMSRIYLGIHYGFDNVEGQAIGNAVADYVVQHAMPSH